MVGFCSISNDVVRKGTTAISNFCTFFLYESQELLQIQSHEMLKIAELSKVCVYMKVFKQIQHFFPLLILHRVVMEPIPGNLEHRAGVPTHYRAQVK